MKNTLVDEQKTKQSLAHHPLVLTSKKSVAPGGRPHDKPAERINSNVPSSYTAHSAHETDGIISLHLTVSRLKASTTKVKCTIKFSRNSKVNKNYYNISFQPPTASGGKSLALNLDMLPEQL
jgi:hypothetical protein